MATMSGVNNNSTAGMEAVNQDHTAGARYPQEFNVDLSKLGALLSEIFKGIFSKLSECVSEVAEFFSNKDVKPINYEVRCQAIM